VGVPIVDLPAVARVERGARPITLVL
jgi:hypothetical protein